MKTIIVFTVCLALLYGGTASAESHSRVQWDVSDGGNGHWYEAVVVPSGITWSEADAAARSVGGYLATIASESENAFVYSLITDDEFWHVGNTSNGPWIGGYQDRNAPDYSEPGGGWRWVTDEPFTYTNWTPGALNNGNGGTEEDYMMFGGWGSEKTAKWNDAPNGPNIGYVIEYNSIPEPSTLLALTLALTGLGGTFVRRKRA